MALLKRCDGSVLEYEPEFETTSECHECGHIRSIEPIEINQPEFHIGPWEKLEGHKHQCLTCKGIEFDTSFIVTQELERVSKQIPKLFDQDTPFYKFFNGK
jgi:hypothetical protein